MSAPSPAKGAPQRIVLEGRYARLEPLADQHAAGLFAAASVPDAADRFAYLPSYPPTSIEEMRDWIATWKSKDDPLMFAVVERHGGTAGGRQALMRTTPEHGVIEVGHVYWGPSIARSRVTTEALYLFASYVFENLGYRRFEWKCNERNEASKSAAQRFGFSFEGVFRQHMIVKGASRDTAWFSMLDNEWPRLKTEYERWLEPSNFDADGLQKTKLRF